MTFGMTPSCAIPLVSKDCLGDSIGSGGLLSRESLTQEDE